MLEIILCIVIILSAILALIQKDLLKAAILTGITGASVAVLFQVLLAPDVALTQAIVEGAIIPIFIALAVKKFTGGYAFDDKPILVTQGQIGVEIPLAQITIDAQKWKNGLASAGASAVSTIAGMIGG